MAFGKIKITHHDAGKRFLDPQDMNAVIWTPSCLSIPAEALYPLIFCGMNCNYALAIRSKPALLRDVFQSFLLNLILIGYTAGQRVMRTQFTWPKVWVHCRGVKSKLCAMSVAALLQGMASLGFLKQTVFWATLTGY